MGYGKELNLLGSVSMLYLCFVSWGYLQEKITSTSYHAQDSNQYRWKFPLALNCIMAIGACIVATFVTALFVPKSNTTPSAPVLAFIKPSLSCAVASPIGYLALEYINFPLMILTKSSKPVPVMMIGILFYGQRYTWYKYLSTSMICGGIILFSAFKSTADNLVNRTLLDELTGIFLVTINLFLDGYTSNQQDYLFSKYKTPSETMMRNVNFFQALILFSFLLCGYALMGNASELMGAYYLILNSAQLRYDILLFCSCASIGQIFIFKVMKEFGSLAWITISITRKLVTVLVSVFMFNHSVKAVQWLGVASVFIGMAVEIFFSYNKKEVKMTKEVTAEKGDSEDEKKKK